MIRDFAELTLANGLTVLYGALAAAVLAGAVLGVGVVLLTAAASAAER